MFKMSSYFFEKFGNKKKSPSSVLLQVKMKKKKPPSLICFRENWPENQRINFMWPNCHFCATFGSSQLKRYLIEQLLMLNWFHTSCMILYILAKVLIVLSKKSN